MMDYPNLNIWFPPETWPYLKGVCCSLIGKDGAAIITKPMTGLAIVDGAADADDVKFGVVDYGKVVAAWRIHVGERGIARYPYTIFGTGGIATMLWDNGPNRIFRLELP